MKRIMMTGLRLVRPAILHWSQCQVASQIVVDETIEKARLGGLFCFMRHIEKYSQRFLQHCGRTEKTVGHLTKLITRIIFTFAKQSALCLWQTINHNKKSKLTYENQKTNLEARPVLATGCWVAADLWQRSDVLFGLRLG
jgi:hypothetical protein